MSFGEETEFNMLTGSVRRKKDHVYRFGNLELLKTAAIYGANGAGKSNLVMAINQLKETVIDDDGVDKFRFEPFRLKPQLKEEPCKFEIEFITNKRMYSYGIAVLDEKIIEEWLYRTDLKKDQLIFERHLKKGKTIIKPGDKYFEGIEDKIRFKIYEEELLSDTVPLLKLMSKAKMVKQEIKDVFLWFSKELVTIHPETKVENLPASIFFTPNLFQFAEDFLKTLNTGIDKLELETIGLDSYLGEDDKLKAEEVRSVLKRSNEKEYFPILEGNSDFNSAAVWENGKIVVKRLVAYHKNEKGDKFRFDLDEQSAGTQRILDFVVVLYEALYEDKTFVIDEIEQSIHPHLLKRLTEKFVNDPKTKGQLIFTTHESNLLDQNIFRQDEIWFAEKKETGETSLYPLSDFKIRFDLDIEKGYLNGRFGAIPFMGNLEKLNWRNYAS